MLYKNKLIIQTVPCQGLDILMSLMELGWRMVNRFLDRFSSSRCPSRLRAL